MHSILRLCGQTTFTLGAAALGALRILCTSHFAPPVLSCLSSDHRLRGYYGDRFDARANLVDWDYHMRLKSVVRGHALVHSILARISANEPTGERAGLVHSLTRLCANSLVCRVTRLPSFM